MRSRLKNNLNELVGCLFSLMAHKVDSQISHSGEVSNGVLKAQGQSNRRH
jgi:hypothetical protein